MAVSVLPVRSESSNRGTGGNRFDNLDGPGVTLFSLSKSGRKRGVWALWPAAGSGKALSALVLRIDADATVRARDVSRMAGHGSTTTHRQRSGMVKPWN